MDPMQLITAARNRRAAADLVSASGIHCPTQAWKSYYDARDAAPRDTDGRVKLTAALRALRAAAVASTAV